MPDHPLILSALLCTQLTLTILRVTNMIAQTIILLIIALVIVLSLPRLLILLILILSLPLLLLITLVLRHYLVSPLLQVHLLLLVRYPLLVRIEGLLRGSWGVAGGGILLSHTATSHHLSLLARFRAALSQASSFLGRGPLI